MPIERNGSVNKSLHWVSDRKWAQVLKNVEAGMSTHRARMCWIYSVDDKSSPSISAEALLSPQMYRKYRPKELGPSELSEKIPVLNGTGEKWNGFSEEIKLRNGCSITFDKTNNDLNPLKINGFISYPSTVMEKYSKSTNRASSPSKLMPKKWRGKTKSSSSNVTSTSYLWSPKGSCQWSSMSGRQVVLSEVSLLSLTDLERITLQRIVFARIARINLGCTITIPKEGPPSTKPKRRTTLLKRRAHSISLLENIKERKEKDSPSGLVFAVPLSKCLQNDVVLRRNDRRDSEESSSSLQRPLQQSHKESVSSSSTSISENLSVNQAEERPRAERTASSESLADSESSRQTHTSLLDALSLSMSSTDNLRRDRKRSLTINTPQIPYVVYSCFKHLETYGLHVLGIFRIGNSKKRTRQLRDDFDSGKEIHLTAEHNPHDVGGLLKEYFRDLPEPLLTRELYSAFVATTKLQPLERQIEALKYLMVLLPTANRDTLWALLRFLAKVVNHSTDTIDENRHMISGNKMDSHNLATLFGPNILRTSRTGTDMFTVESVERAEERREVIQVIKNMINHYDKLFMVSPELLDEVYKVLLAKDPEALDYLLKKKSSLSVLDASDTESIKSGCEGSDTSSQPHSGGSTGSLHRSPSKESQTSPALGTFHRSVSRESQSSPGTTSRMKSLTVNEAKAAMQVRQLKSLQRERTSSDPLILNKVERLQVPQLDHFSSLHVPDSLSPEWNQGESNVTLAIPPHYVNKLSPDRNPRTRATKKYSEISKSNTSDLANMYGKKPILRSRSTDISPKAKTTTESPPAYRTRSATSYVNINQIDDKSPSPTSHEIRKRTPGTPSSVPIRRERWKRWEAVTSENNGQETLV